MILAGSIYKIEPAWEPAWVQFTKLNLRGIEFALTQKPSAGSDPPQVQILRRFRSSAGSDL